MSEKREFDLMPRLYWSLASVRRNESVVLAAIRTMRRLPAFEHVVVTYDEDIVQVEDENIHTVLSACPPPWDGQMASRGAFIAAEVAGLIAENLQPCWGVVCPHLSRLTIIDSMVNQGLAWGVPMICWLTTPPEIGKMAESSQQNTPLPAQAAPWAWLAHSNHAYLALPDNASQWRIAWEGMGVANSRHHKVEALRYTEYLFEPPGPELLTDKEDAAMFGSRMNGTKGTDVAAEIMYHLPDSITKIATAPQRPGGKRDQQYAGMMEAAVDEFYVPCPKEEYLDTLARAKLCVIATQHEGGRPTGYFEAAAKGALWLVRRREWALDLIGPDWPLFWTNVDEAVEKAEWALGRYEQLLEEQTARLRYRLSDTINVEGVIEAVGRENSERVGEGQIESCYERVKEGFWEYSQGVTMDPGTGGSRGQWRVAEAMRRARMEGVEAVEFERLGNHAQNMHARWQQYRKERDDG